jgi:hypothetical protein
VPLGAGTASDEDATYCGCPECTQNIWDLDAEDYSCGARITWLLKNEFTNYPAEDTLRKKMYAGWSPVTSSQISAVPNVTLILVMLLAGSLCALTV